MSFNTMRFEGAGNFSFKIVCFLIMVVSVMMLLNDDVIMG
jgi:hypothetical protein